MMDWKVCFSVIFKFRYSNMRRMAGKRLYLERKRIARSGTWVLWDLAWYWTQVVALLPVCAETAPTDGGHHGDSQRANIFIT